MAIGRRYYYAAALLLASLYCVSHYKATYPERGWKPWSGWGNVWKEGRQTEKQKKQRAKGKEDERRAREKRAKKAARAAREEAQKLHREEKGETEREESKLRDRSGERILKVYEETRLGSGYMMEESLSGKRKMKVIEEDRVAAESEPVTADGSSAFVDREMADGEADEDLNPVVREKGPPPKKKLRIQTNLEITYDHTGTPIIANSPSSATGRHHGAGISLGGNASFAAAGSRLNIPEHLHQPLSASSLTTGLSNLALLSAHPPRPANTLLSPGKSTFSLIEALCKDNSILIHLISFLTIPSILVLYRTSKRFHYLLNRHQTAYILASMRTWAPGSDKIFPWRCYRSLCLKDPVKNQKARLIDEAPQPWHRKFADTRDVPSLRWLQMVVWREGASRDILIQLRVQGLRCPAGTLEAVKKLWFVMDLPLNAHRIALFRCLEYITPTDLENMTHFLIKVDMFFTNPIQGTLPINHPNQRTFPNKWGGRAQSGVRLRKFLFAERQLTSLWRVIRGWSPDPESGPRPMIRLDALKLWVRHKYKHPPGTPDDVLLLPIMGVPAHEVGTAGLERTGVSYYDLVPEKPKLEYEDDDEEVKAEKRVMLTHPLINNPNAQAVISNSKSFYPHALKLHLTHEKPREPLLRPDELVLREAIRRGTQMHKKWVNMMLWGFCDINGEELPRETEEEILRGLMGDMSWAQTEGEADMSLGGLKFFSNKGTGRTGGEGPAGTESLGNAAAQSVDGSADVGEDASSVDTDMLGSFDDMDQGSDDGESSSGYDSDGDYDSDEKME